jgi:hypothetical protein
LIIALLLPALAAVWVGCSQPAPQASSGEMAAAEPPAARPEASAGVEGATESAAVAMMAVSAAGGDAAAAGAPANSEQAPSPVPRSSRKVIKNGDLRLAVDDTDVAVSGVTQIAADVGGYILSSRAWTQEDAATGEPHRYATITISVPADRFEEALNRLRGLAVRVLDESATGEDVTDQFVDLESQLRNHQATRDRIRGFLEQAQTVEEALRVNEQLARVEAEIERIQGQIHYLAGRSAFSTIAVNIEPDLPPLAAAPEPTPEVWSARATFAEAGGALQIVAQRFADLLIWFGVVLLPFILLMLLVAWPIWRFWPRVK